MREISQDEFAARHAEGAVVIDVREPSEYIDGHVPGARPFPMGQLPSRLGEIAKDEQIFVICASGGRSAAMTDFLEQAGYDAYSVAEGTGGWAGSGRPLVRGTSPHEEMS